MANTGYKINPYLVQNFNSGPSSGSLVSSSYVITFDVSSSFTSSIVCNNNYEYKIFDPINCEVSSSCIPPTIIKLNPIGCDGSYNYNYNIKYQINDTISNIPDSLIEYSNSSTFISSSTVSVNSQSISNTNSLMTASINISDMNNLPINGSTTIYFRLYNLCTVNGTSIYDEGNTKCLTGNNGNGGNETSSLTLTILAQNNNTLTQCDSDNSGFGDGSGWLGNPYYIDSPNFSSATNIYINNSNPPTPAPSNWYNNNSIARFWNGTNFGASIFCS